MPVGVRFGRTASWFGSRRASTLLAFLAIFTMGPLILLSILSVNSTYSALTDTSNHRLVDAGALATSLGALDYFVKPVDAKELVNRLSEFNVKADVGEQRRAEEVKEGVLAS